jgi:hypothetical protein
MLWNYSDLARLAPDPATLQRARGVSFALKNWLELAGNERIVWGQYEGGGGHQRYRVAVDMENSRFYCTCRSPRFPCKHTLAMPMILVRNNESFRVDYEPPDWVRKAWTTGDQPKKKPKISEGPSDERLLRMQAGLSELEAWLVQIIENGLATIDPQDHSFWEELATRMTDNQLSGPAARIRSLVQEGPSDDWYDRLLSTLSELYLLIRAFKRYYQLPPDLQQELLNVAGVTVRRDRVMQEPAITDRWLVVAVREGEERENLFSRRTWLLGEESGRLALLLDFNWNQQGYREEWSLGMTFSGEIHYYPGNYPLRAIVSGHQATKEPFTGLSGIFSFAEWPDYLGKALAGNPWLYNFPCLLAAVLPVFKDEQYWLIDTDGEALQVRMPEQVFWKLMAVSSGYPISVFCEWGNGVFRPLSIVSPEKVIDLDL